MVKELNKKKTIKLTSKAIKNMVIKHTKHTQEWFDEVKKSIPITEKVDNIEKAKIEILKEDREKIINEYNSKESKIKNYELLTLKEQDRLNKKSNWVKFMGDGTGANEWNTSGWNRTIEAWLNGKTNNICKLNITANTLNQNSTISNLEITEDEAQALLLRAVKAFENIDNGDFKHQVDSGVGNKNTISASNAKNYLDNIQNFAKKLVKNKNFGREGYELGYNHTNFDKVNKKFTQTPTVIDTDKFNWDDLVNLAKYIDADDWSENSHKLNQSNFNPPVEWKIYKKGDKYTSQELKNLLGDITLNSATTEYYKSGYKKNGTDTTSWKVNNLITVQLKTIRDWARLVLTVDNASLTKIKNNTLINTGETFTDNPYNKLFKEIRQTKDSGLFEQNSSDYAIDAVNETIITAQMNAYIAQMTNLKVEQDKANDKKIEIEAEMQKLITDKIKEIRTELGKDNLEKGFEDKSKETNGLDNRKTYPELRIIKDKLEIIRFLENDDSSQNSSVEEENTAYNEVKKLVDKFNSSYMQWFSSVDGNNNEEKCAKIKEKENDLEKYFKSYEYWEDVIKFTDNQKAEFKAIKIALGKEKDETENLKVYTDKLKLLDANLETNFTEELKTKWQKENNFKTIQMLNSLLESVKKDDKYEDFFNHIKGGTNGYEEVKEIDTFGKLLVKEPKVVITTIKRYEFDNMDDSGEDENKKKTQTERKIKKALGKKGTDNLTDTEINQVIYEVAVGQKTLSDKSLKSDLSEYEERKDENNKPPKSNEKEEKTHLEKYKWWYIGIGTLVLLGLVAAALFWKQIKSWWAGPEEEKIEEPKKMKKNQQWSNENLNSNFKK